MQDFHQLKVWQKAHSLAMDVYRITDNFPRGYSATLTTQLRRAALSIPTNIAEGAGKPSNPEFRRFLEVALGSASETIYLLLVARELGILELACHEDFSNRAVEIRKMLTSLTERVRTRNPEPLSRLPRKH